MCNDVCVSLYTYLDEPEIPLSSNEIKGSKMYIHVYFIQECMHICAVILNTYICKRLYVAMLCVYMYICTYSKHRKIHIGLL